jgi:hypothetical protein
MRVRFPTSRTTPVITLGRGERALWGATTADARDINSARRVVDGRVKDLIRAGATVVEVYAPAVAGGFMVEQVTADLLAAV